MLYYILVPTIMWLVFFLAYGRFSNEDPAKSGLESTRILNVEDGFSWNTV